MSVLLQIEFDGDGPGIAEGRLSLGEFAGALDLLVKALRRIASGIVTDALEDASYGARGGRLEKTASRLDIHLTGVRKGSVEPQLIVVQPSPLAGSNLRLFEALPERTVAEFLEAVKSEGEGIPRSVVVRKYLCALPAWLSRQTYRGYDGERLLDEVTLRGPLPQVDEIALLPMLSQHVGEVAGLIFDASGRSEVRIRTEGGQFSGTASDALVEKAIELRKTQVRAIFCSTTGKPRLVRIEADDPATADSVGEIPTERILKKWAPLLERLAR